MGAQTGISWTEATWNPFYGCSKVSEGCKNCYMYRDQIRYGNNPAIVQKSKTNFDKPLKWKEGKLIFTCSWSDFFIEEGDQYRDELWKIIKATPQHTYQILTKRPERIKQCLPADWGSGYENVWLGISAENQQRYDERLKQFSHIEAKVKFLSLEPLLSDIWLFREYAEIYPFKELINWVIIGGESGNMQGKFVARECNLQWIYSLVQQCMLVDVPVFVKQFGTILAYDLRYNDKAGANMAEWPEPLRIQQYPEVYYKNKIADAVVKNFNAVQDSYL